MSRAARHCVFINCPFDSTYSPHFRAIVFAVLACGLHARCALEIDDAGETRIEKLYRIIGESDLGIHDLSRTELDVDSGLPRFNMPLELGIFLGARKFGDLNQTKKRAMILDIERYRFQKFVSDLAGMDITPHNGDSKEIVQCVRDWLVSVSNKKKKTPPVVQILDSYDRFTSNYPTMVGAAGLRLDKVAFADLERLILSWVKAELAAGALSPPA